MLLRNKGLIWEKKEIWKEWEEEPCDVILEPNYQYQFMMKKVPNSVQEKVQKQ